MALTIISLICLILPLKTLAGGFNWLEDPATEKYGSLAVSAGAKFVKEAPFPFTGLTGDMRDLGWVELRYGVGEDISLFAHGVIRKYLKVHKIDPAIASDNLENPVTLDQTRQATGDFSFYTKWRVTRFANALDFGILLGFSMPNTNVTSGMGVDAGAMSGRALLGLDLGSSRLVANLGIAIVHDPTTNTGQDDFLTYGLGLQTQALPALRIFGEYYAYEGPKDGIQDGLFDSLNVSLGISYTLRKLEITIVGTEYLADYAPDRAISLRLTRRFFPLHRRAS